MKYIHYKLSQRGYEWDAGDASAAAPGATPAPGIFSSQPGRTPAPTRTSPPPPVAPAAAAAGPALSPVPPVVHLTLRQAGDDFSRRYRRDFAEMSSQLHLTPFTARGRFATVVEELFRDGVNWGRIVAFFEFGGVMCVESVNREMSPLVDNIALWMTEYLNRHLHTWIQDNGGWVGACLVERESGMEASGLRRGGWSAGGLPGQGPAHEPGKATRACCFPPSSLVRNSSCRPHRERSLPPKVFCLLASLEVQRPSVCCPVRCRDKWPPSGVPWNAGVQGSPPPRFAGLCSLWKRESPVGSWQSASYANSPGGFFLVLKFEKHPVRRTDCLQGLRGKPFLTHLVKSTPRGQPRWPLSLESVAVLLKR